MNKQKRAEEIRDILEKKLEREPTPEEVERVEWELDTLAAIVFESWLDKKRKEKESDSRASADSSKTC